MTRDISKTGRKRKEKKMKKYFITGIGTGVGKTVVSAIIVEALKADYWKPVQAGGLDNTDTDVVKSLVSNGNTKYFPETYKFKTPASPHYAAEVENIKVSPADFKIPETKNNLIIEGAGGLMVPLNDDFLMIDLIKQLNAEVILVSQNYLGSINHTLLSIDALKTRNIPVKGIVFNGEQNPSSEKYILESSGFPCILRLPNEEKIDKEAVLKNANKISKLF
jgi:dethiobiotin synthetase